MLRTMHPRSGRLGWMVIEEWGTHGQHLEFRASTIQKLNLMALGNCTGLTIGSAFNGKKVSFSDFPMASHRKETRLDGSQRMRQYGQCLGLRALTAQKLVTMVLSIGLAVRSAINCKRLVFLPELQTMGQQEDMQMEIQEEWDEVGQLSKNDAARATSQYLGINDLKMGVSCAWQLHRTCCWIHHWQQKASALLSEPWIMGQLMDSQMASQRGGTRLYGCQRMMQEWQCFDLWGSTNQKIGINIALCAFIERTVGSTIKDKKVVITLVCCWFALSLFWFWVCLFFGYQFIFLLCHSLSNPPIPCHHLSDGENLVSGFPASSFLGPILFSCSIALSFNSSNSFLSGFKGKDHVSCFPATSF